MTAQSPARPAADRLDVLGNLLSFRLRAAQTGGAFSLIDCECLPGAGSPPHFQADHEAFVVLEGEMEFVLGDSARRAGPGSVVTVAPDTVHAFRNPGERSARMLIVNWPGGAHEVFFEAVGTPLQAGAEPVAAPPDMARIFAAAAANGITLLPPA